ncbi:MAG: hypothetical protein ACFCU5_19395 [Pleurocapsa sp.]
MTGFIPFVVLERILTHIRYGSWTATSTSLHLQIFAKAHTLTNVNEIVQGDNNSFFFLKLLTKVKPEALLAPLFSPEKSIFLYDPLLLPCLIIAFICWRFLSPYIRWYVVATILSFLLYLYIYSWTSDWIEQRAWGARYHITSVHLLLVPLIPLLIQGATNKNNTNTDFLKAAFSWIARVTIILSILIQFAFILLPHGLEVNQQKLGIGSQFRIFQRINNIFYLLNYNQESNVQLPNFQEHYSEKMSWDLLPFKLKNKLGANSPFNKFIPILFVFWGLILVFTITMTLWIFMT